MEFPFGHNPSQTRHHHHQRDEDDDGADRPSRTSAYPPPPFDQPPPPFGHPPPPHYGVGRDEFEPPPPRPSNVYHSSHVPPPFDPYPPPPHPAQDSGYGSNYPPYRRPQESEDSFSSYPPQQPPSSHVPPPYDPYPPPAQDSGYGSNYPPYRRPQESESSYSDYPPQQPPSSVHHVSHETEETHHSYRPHMPAFVHHHTSEKPSDSVPVVTVGGGGSGLAAYFSNKSTVKVYCKAEPNYTLTIRDDKVILARYNPNDPTQQWYKDEKFSTRVKDEEGFPCFSLVNKATGQAIKHSVGASHPVQLEPYSPDKLDSSILWTLGKDLGDGYRAVRMVNNVRLNLDAFHGDKKSGGVHDGTTIVLWQLNKGDNQLWKIATAH